MANLRVEAISWWVGLTDVEKHETCHMVISVKRSYKSVTGSEIEKMYKWAKNIR